MISTTQRPALLCTLLLLPLTIFAGCSAHADIPEVVVTQSEVVFDGVPVINGRPESSRLDTSFDHPEGFELPDFLTTELRPLGAVLMAADPYQDLAFITSLSLTIESKLNDELPRIEVATYTRDSMDASNSIEIEANSDADVLKYWRTDAALYQLTVISGALPEAPWEVDVVVKFSGSLSINSQ